MRYSFPQTIIASPSLNNDWNEFIKTNPDLTSVLEWIRNNIEPDEIYNKYSLGKKYARYSSD